MHHVPPRPDTQPHRDGLSAFLWAILSAVVSCAAAALPKLSGDTQTNTTL
jgi:hypothetical protein